MVGGEMSLTTGAPHSGHFSSGAAEEDRSNSKPGRQWSQASASSFALYSYIGMGSSSCCGRQDSTNVASAATS